MADSSPDRVVTFFVPGIAETKGSMVPVTRGVLRADNDREKAWRSTVGWYAKIAMRGIAIFYTRVSVTIYVTLPVPPNRTKKHRRDADKVARSMLDAFTGVVYVDDELVDDLHVRKRTSSDTKKQGARVIVRVHEPSDEGFEGT